MIYNIHTHVFPDKIAEKASKSIGGFYDLPMTYDGRVQTLLDEAEKLGITRCCVYSVAMNVHSMHSINTFLKSVLEAHGDRVTAMAAICPDCEDFDTLIEEAQAGGFRGFKIHPDMQKFALDSKEAMEMFAAIEGRMPIVIHTGDPRFGYSNPFRMQKVLEAFPKLTCICAHLGGWSEWEDACAILPKYENVYVDTSSSLYALSPEKAVRLIRAYPRERVLFGTDYPMWDTAEELRRFDALALTDAEREAILWDNAMRLIG